MLGRKRSCSGGEAATSCCLSPHPDAEQVLEMTGVTDLLPILRDEASALAAVSA